MVTYVAFMAPVIVGVAALGIEIVTWHAESRGVQLVADGAALAGVYSGVREGRSASTIQAAVEAQVVANGYDASEVTVFWPPQISTVSGVVGNQAAVEVVLERQVPSMLASVMGQGQTTVAARAVAIFDTPDCVLALNETESGTIEVTGSSVVTFPCSMHSNSTSPSSVKQTGTTSFLISSGGSIDTVGGASGTNIFPSPSEGVDEEPNPFSDLPIPTYACQSFGSPDITVTTTVTYTAAADSAFCDELVIEGSAVVHFEPGLYVFEAGLSIAGGAVVTGTDVTFYFAPTDPNAISITGGADVTLSAPSDGAYAGILIFVDPNQPPQVFRMAGGSNMVLDGIIYGPTVDMEFAGGAFGGETPTMLVTDTVRFVGTTFLGDLVDSQAGQGGALVEATIIE